MEESQAFEKSRTRRATRGIVQILGIIMKSKVSMPKLKPAGFKFNSALKLTAARVVSSEKQTKKVPLLALNSLITNPVFMSFGWNFR